MTICRKGSLAFACLSLSTLGGILWCSGITARQEAQADDQTVSIGAAMRALVEADWIDQDRLYEAKKSNVPILTKVNSSGVTTEQDASGGCDGVKNGRCGFHVASGESDPWWQVDLGEVVKLDRVVIYNRTDGATAARTKRIGIRVAIDAENGEFVEVYRHNGETFYGVNENKPLVVDLRTGNIAARIVRLDVPGRCSLALDEVEVYARDDPKNNIALGKPADQKSISPYSYPGTRGHVYKPAKPPEPKTAMFTLAHTRDVIERGYQLADRFRDRADSARLGPLVAKLDALDVDFRKLESADDVPEDVRRQHYLAARRLVREIAFCNPLLDFDRILFIKRHDPGGLYHMVHQYYGFCSNPGGGLFVLCDPFSSDPKVADLLEDSVVERGRLAGSKLVPGTFLSPDLSYDGQQILFAYTEGRADGIEWSEKASYHIFQVNADGSGLVQLTDGRWNDFDPCFLPGGRVVFVSERRGGYLRCGGSAPPYDSPTYTLHSMEADGSDIICLSFHETQEWHPSVDNNGMIVYTRWDYVDRDTNVAHHIWNCYADGRNPRSYHGNYPTRRESRPWMEMSIRAVPGSNKYVATAAAHHGLAFGSLVSIDYRPLDDGAMSQVERLTPEAPLPEAEGGKAMIRQRMAYGTAWPLSEDDYLCVYDSRAKNRGIYWIDRFGNRELLYRDPTISCLSPIPLRPRPRPPGVPEGTTQTAAARSLRRSSASGGREPADNPPVSSQRASTAASENGCRAMNRTAVSGASRSPLAVSSATPEAATVALMNVYDSDFPWPDETRITALRVIQVLPKTTPPVNQPRIGVATETNARAVLGTVPVEADGSAYFESPVGKLVYFQALDERGMAVQSMRSGAYLHPGESLTCQGCHEAKHRSPSVPTTIPLALRRPPSQIKPDWEGSNPFNFTRLVQPVLDRHCVDCHQQKNALDLTGVIEGKHGWTRSYANLAEKYGFYFHVSNGSINSGVHGGSRAIAGGFGARASRLLEYVDERHYGVNLANEDFHRMTLWLDCNSEFYGAYYNTEAQARGEIVCPRLD